VWQVETLPKKAGRWGGGVRSQFQRQQNNMVFFAYSFSVLVPCHECGKKRTTRGLCDQLQHMIRNRVIIFSMQAYNLLLLLWFSCWECVQCAGLSILTVLVHVYSQRVLNDLYRARLSRRRMICLLLHPLPTSSVSKLSLFLGLPECRRSSFLRREGGRGGEPNHTKARQPGPL
jgi:hypothetical protein